MFNARSSPLFALLLSVLALFGIATFSSAQPPGTVAAASPMRGVTPWTAVDPRIYWPADWQAGIPEPPQDFVLQTLHVPEGGKLTVRMECAFSTLTENTWPTAITGYQIGTGFNLRAGELGIQLCSNVCSGALAPTDGVTYQPPSPLPATMLGFPAGQFDYHYVPVGLISMPVTQAFPGGPLEIKASAYSSMQDWNGELNPNQSHGYTFRYPACLVRAVWSWAPADS